MTDTVLQHDDRDIAATDTLVPQAQLISLLHALQAMRRGDFTVRLTDLHDGILGRIADTFNDIVAANEGIANQLEEVGQTVGRDDSVVRLGVLVNAAPQPVE